VAIAFDAATSNDNVSSTFAHTCAVGATILFVGWRNNGTLSGVTYAGVSMTQIQSTVSNTDQYSFWYILNPASGANNVVLSGSGITTQWAVAASYTGSRVVNAIDVSGTVALVNASPLSIPLTTTVNNDWTAAFVYDRSGTNFTANANCVKRTQPSNGASMAFFDSNGPVAAGSFTMSVNEGASNAGAIQAAFMPPVKASMMVVF
jgi:hypothetical protein